MYVCRPSKGQGDTEQQLDSPLPPTATQSGISSAMPPRPLPPPWPTTQGQAPLKKPATMKKTAEQVADLFMNDDENSFEEEIPIHEEGVSEAVNKVLIQEIRRVLPAQKETGNQRREVDPERFNITGNHFIAQSLVAKAKKEEAEKVKAERKRIREEKKGGKKRNMADSTPELYVSHRDLTEAGPSGIKMPFWKKARREAPRSLTSSDEEIEAPIAKNSCNNGRCKKNLKACDEMFKYRQCPRKYHRDCLPQYVLDQLDDEANDPMLFFIDCDLCT